jgi:nucleolar protein 53
MPIIKRKAAAPEAPAQHNQKSRKGKKAWRKNVDVTEVQEGLEAVRDEVIKTGYAQTENIGHFRKHVLTFNLVVLSPRSKMRIFSCSMSLETLRSRRRS